ncbi:MAG: hypothetical protein H6765_01885 [Candidatus Peribacteria bacterium]|nr:MAG: hypothetical protein H6765_01885 [Candidatus Peribacteria bacterium]
MCYEGAVFLSGRHATFWEKEMRTHMSYQAGENIWEHRRSYSFPDGETVSVQLHEFLKEVNLQIDDPADAFISYIYDPNDKEMGKMVDGMSRYYMSAVYYRLLEEDIIEVAQSKDEFNLIVTEFTEKFRNGEYQEFRKFFVEEMATYYAVDAPIGYVALEAIYAKKKLSEVNKRV